MLNNKLSKKLAWLSFLCFGPLHAAEGLKVNIDVWADNWFALYVNEDLVKEDSVSINTERSFNAESFQTVLPLPATINMVVKDFKENDTGLEYIGSRRQQMGDGGFIMQVKDAHSGDIVAVSGSQWRCKAIHIAPLNKSCEKSSNPAQDCQANIIDEPANWKSVGFNHKAWPQAIEYSESAVSPKMGYDRINWDSSAKLIWTQDLETDNTLLCSYTIKAG